VDISPASVGASSVGSGPVSVTISVEDMNGNITEEQISAYVYDKTAPSLQCKGLSEIQLSTSGLFIPEYDDLVSSASDAVSGTLLYSFAPLFVDCNSLGETVTLSVTAIDASGNASTCTMDVLVTDDGSTCLLPRIAGAILLPSGSPKADVMVTANSDMMDDMTDASGQYTFDDLNRGDDYMIAPESDDNYLLGVSTWDIVQIRKHLLGIAPFDSPYKHIAADINNDGRITTFDLLELRKTILGISPGFPNNTAWRFVDASFDFPDPLNPLASPFPEQHECYDVLDDQMHRDFIAVKIGDVETHYNLNNNSQNRSVNDLPIAIEQSESKIPGFVTYAIIIKENVDLEGLQLALDLGDGRMTFKSFVQGALTEVGKDNFGLKGLSNGKLLFSWDSPQVAQLYRGDVLFSMTLKSATSTSFEADIDWNSIESMAIEVDAGPRSVIVDGVSVVKEDAGFELFQNKPNPFDNTTLIQAILPVPGETTLAIHDVHGKEVWRNMRDAKSGFNEWKIDTEILPGLGIYYYTLTVGDHSATKRMVYVR
jgi:hypothetical protein